MSGIDLADVAREWCRVNGWTMVQPSGHGAYKETFQVVDSQGENIALKVYRGNSHSERTSREIDAMRRCNCSAIVRLYGVSHQEFQGHQYLVSTEPFIEGGTLQDRIRTSYLFADEVSRLGDTLVEAVAHLEHLHLVHRDVKPENVMLPGGDIAQAVVVDFGLVRDMAASSLTATFFMRGPGTPLYASPEQLNNDKAMIGPPSDQYSLGIVLAVAATGVHPFDESGSDMFELMRMQRQGELEMIVERMASRDLPAQDLREHLPGPLAEVIQRMLLPWPVMRFAQPGALSTRWRDLRARP